MLGGMYDKLGMKKSTFLAVLAITVGLAGLYFGKYPAAHVMVIVGGGAGLCVGYGVLPDSGTVGLRHAGLCDDLRHRQRSKLAGRLHQPVVFQPRL